jgi:hypothetical protein
MLLMLTEKSVGSFSFLATAWYGGACNWWLAGCFEFFLAMWFSSNSASLKSKAMMVFMRS